VRAMFGLYVFVVVAGVLASFVVGLSGG
jgi:hypothetical protein